MPSLSPPVGVWSCPKCVWGCNPQTHRTRLSDLFAGQSARRRCPGPTLSKQVAALWLLHRPVCHLSGTEVPTTESSGDCM